MYTNTDWNRYVTGNVMDVYGANASAYCEMPNQLQRENGVIPLDSLPAQWWNALWNMVTTKVTGALSTSLTSIREELVSLVTNNGICLDSTSSSQVYCAIELMTQRLATEAIAGAIKSSSTCGKISVNATTGVATANGLGDISQACTTAKTSAVAAINELVACDSCLRTDIDNIEAGIGSGIDVYCNDTCKCTIDSNTALCLCGQAFQNYVCCVSSKSTLAQSSQLPFLTTLHCNEQPTCLRYSTDAYICTTSAGAFCYACIPTICGYLCGTACWASGATCACGAVNSTCFNGCTYDCAKADIRSGLTSCTGTVTVSNSSSSSTVPIALCTGTATVGKSIICTLTFTPTTGQITTNASVCIMSSCAGGCVVIGSCLSCLTNATATVGNNIANATYGIAFGTTITNASSSVAFGSGITNSTGGIAVGKNIGMTGTCGVGIGVCVCVTGACSIGMGPESQVTGTCSVGIGPAVKSLGGNSVAIGRGALACCASSVALGYSAKSRVDYGIAIGQNAHSISVCGFTISSFRVSCKAFIVSLAHDYSWGATYSLCNIQQAVQMFGCCVGYKTCTATWAGVNNCYGISSMSCDPYIQTSGFRVGCTGYLTCPVCMWNAPGQSPQTWKLICCGDTTSVPHGGFGGIYIVKFS